MRPSIPELASRGGSATLLVIISAINCWATLWTSLGMTIILDSGGLIAIDRRDPRVGVLLRVAQRSGVPVMSTKGAVAQGWRSGARQANLARMLGGVKVRPLDDRDGRRVGELIGVNNSADVSDAHVALIAAESDVVITSDRVDITGLLTTRGVRAKVGSA